MVGQTPKVQLVQSVGMLMMMRRRPGAGLGVLEAAPEGDGVLSGASRRDKRSDLHLGRWWGQALLQQHKQERQACQSVPSRHPLPLFSCLCWLAA